MICPRCGLKITISSPSRCPRCSQPLHPPFSDNSRVTKLAPVSEATPSVDSFEQEEWPDLNRPPISSLGIPFRAKSPRSAPKPSDAFAVSAVIEIGRRMPPLQRRLLVAVTAVVLLGVVLGGTVFTLRALTGHSHAPGGPSASTRLHSPTSAASATASAASTATASATKTPVRSPTVTPTPVPQLVTIFYDPLTSNAKKWVTQDGCSFQSDGLHVTGMAQCIAPVTATDTVNISVQMKTVALSMGGAGIGFRVSREDTTHQYAFYLSASGFCQAEDLVTRKNFFATDCSSAHQGANAVNTLVIDQSGAHMTFYVNGTLVGSANDATLATGEVALEGQSRKQSVIFTNFALTTWQ